jgi:hypothetical protein
MSAEDKAQFITPDAYPQMLEKGGAARALKVLRSAQTAMKAAVAMEACVAPMRAAVLQYVGEIEKSTADMAMIFDIAHEIRGLAETAGMITMGRISDLLCHYMDETKRMGRSPDAAIVGLHVSAIGRAARAAEDDIGMGAVVTAELSALVCRKLNDLRTTTKP